VANLAQTLFFVASNTEGRVVDIKNDEVFDLHNDLQVHGFKGALFDEQENCMYIICN
jgi:hypothetical protein